MSSIGKTIVIIGCPRSGTTILRNCLALHNDIWHLRGESHSILEGPLHPAPDYVSNRATADDLTEKEYYSLRRAFYSSSINISMVLSTPEKLFRGGKFATRKFNNALVYLVGKASALYKPSSIHFLEKTPKNILRVPLLDELLDDPLYIWNKREPHANIDSLIDGWYASTSLGPFHFPRYTTYTLPYGPNCPKYPGTSWKFALVPKWDEICYRGVEDIAAWQYLQCNKYALNDLSPIDNSRVFSVKHEKLVERPAKTLKSILEWSGLKYDRCVDTYARKLPVVNSTDSSSSNQRASLRYPHKVDTAIERFGYIETIASRIGY